MSVNREILLLGDRSNVTSKGGGGKQSVTAPYCIKNGQKRDIERGGGGGQNLWNFVLRRFEWSLCTGTNPASNLVINIICSNNKIALLTNDFSYICANL